VYKHSFRLYSIDDSEFNTALLCDDVGSLFCIPLRSNVSDSDSPAFPSLFELEEWQWRPELFNYYGDILGSTSADQKLRLLTVCAFVTKVVVPDAVSAVAEEHGSFFKILNASSDDVLEKRVILSTELQRRCINCHLLGIVLLYIATSGIGACFKKIVVHEMVARTLRHHWRQYLASDAKQGGRSGGISMQLSIFLQRILRNHDNYVSKFLIPSVFEKYAAAAIRWINIANATRVDGLNVISNDEDWCTHLHDHRITIIFMQAGISPTVHIDQPTINLQDLFGTEDVILRFLNLIGTTAQNVEALDVFLKLGKFNSSTPAHVPVNISDTLHKSLTIEIQARIEVDRLTAGTIAVFGTKHRLNEVLRQLELNACLIPYPWFGKTLLARTFVEMGQSVGGELKRAAMHSAAYNFSQALACNPYQSFLLCSLSNFVVANALEASITASKARPQTSKTKMKLANTRLNVSSKRGTTPSKGTAWEWRYASHSDIQSWTLDNLFVLAHVIKDASGFEQPYAWLTHIVGLAIEIVSDACRERISPFCQRGAFEIAGQIFRRVIATMIKWNESMDNFPALNCLQKFFEDAQQTSSQLLGDPQALQITQMIEDNRQLGILLGYCLIQDREEYAKFTFSPRTEFIISGAIGRFASASCLETIVKLRETSSPETSIGLDSVCMVLAESANDRLLKLLRKRMKYSRSLLIGTAPLITNQGLSGLLIRSNNLKTLSFEKCNVASDELLFKIAPILTAVTSLSITSNNSVTDAGVRCIQQMTSLIHLDLHGCFQISDSSMSEVVLQCIQLTTLNMNGCPNIGDETLLSLAMRCYAVQPPKTTHLQAKLPDMSLNGRVQNEYNSASIGSEAVWPEATSTLQPNNRVVVKFDSSGVDKSHTPVSEAPNAGLSLKKTVMQDDEDDGITMSSQYGGVIKEFVDESSFEPLQLQELPMSDRSDVTILIRVHSIFLMEKLFNEVSTLTVNDLYVTASHNNSMHRTEPGKICDQIKFSRTLEIGDIDEVSKRISMALVGRTSLGVLLTYGEILVPLPKFIDVPGDRFRMKIPLSDGFSSKFMKSRSTKTVVNDDNQEVAYKKAKISGKTAQTEEVVTPTIAVMELTVELASPVSICPIPNICSTNDSSSDCHSAPK
jgi:hypothetical protein